MLSNDPYTCTYAIAQIKTIVFDKTGTLTHGKPEVTRVMLFVSERVCPYQLFLAIAGLAESSSEHPLGVAVTNFAQAVSPSNQHLLISHLLVSFFLFGVFRQFPTLDCRIDQFTSEPFNCNIHLNPRNCSSSEMIYQKCWTIRPAYRIDAIMTRHLLERS